LDNVSFDGKTFDSAASSLASGLSSSIAPDTKQTVNKDLQTGSSIISDVTNVGSKLRHHLNQENKQEHSQSESSSESHQAHEEVHMRRNKDGSYRILPLRNPQTEVVGSRVTDGTLNDEMAYNYTDYNTLYVDPNEGSFESGYSMIPPKDWYPVPPHPPVCVAEKVCPVCPVYTNGTNLDLKEWNDSRRITPPDNINVQAIREKLNSGR